MASRQVCVIKYRLLVYHGHATRITRRHALCTLPTCRRQIGECDSALGLLCGGGESLCCVLDVLLSDVVVSCGRSALAVQSLFSHLSLRTLEIVHQQQQLMTLTLT